MEEKIDFKKKFKNLYSPSSREVGIINVPDLKYLMIDGQGIENEAYFSSIQALFGVSFKVKFMVKRTEKIDYSVMPLEGLWWADDMDDFINGNKDRWKWTLMIMQPDFVSKEIIEEAVIEIKKKNNIQRLDLLRLENLKEDIAVQLMHIGPYSDEHENIMRIHKVIDENNGKFDGKFQKHHEIYLSDYRKTAPEKLKTIIRQPFIKV